jgi:hypothetical protein
MIRDQRHGVVPIHGFSEAPAFSTSTKSSTVCTFYRLYPAAAA